MNIRLVCVILTEMILRFIRKCKMQFVKSKSFVDILVIINILLVKSSQEQTLNYIAIKIFPVFD